MDGQEDGQVAAAYRTDGGVAVTRTVEAIEGASAIDGIARALDTRRGVLLTSGFEYPGRYSRWDLGFVDPLLALSGRGRQLTITACNARGRVALSACHDALRGHPHVAQLDVAGDALTAQACPPPTRMTEEERTRQPSLLSLLRALREFFASPEDRHLGFYGAFGYDLVFTLDAALTMDKAREPDQRDLVLYLPEALVVVDHQSGRAERVRYTLSHGGRSTAEADGGGEQRPYVGREHLERTRDEIDRTRDEIDRTRDHAPGDYAEVVRRARGRFARGELFEVTPSQVFRRPCPLTPSQVMARLRRDNPAPYGFLINLGGGEYLVGASPEMYVRVDGRRVETCPIAGTVPRGEDALGDAAQIKRLLASDKEESELTMCTDVDRNDKARVCEPGSVHVIGRRQIELYSRLIHTVDHVEGQLREGYDGLDAFMTHLWAVTVTGAPKLAAMQFIEQQERSPRRFYGGAVGAIGFDGRVNTGLTLRTMRIADGVAEVRAGATLLFDSDPDDEEAESELKASALLGALSPEPRACAREVRPRPGDGKRVLLVDHEDSFVHTLADYLRQTGARVETLRHGFEPAELERLRPDLVVLSPGPGRPQDFHIDALLQALRARSLPTFGVCLGLQAIAEHFGGTLGQLDYPMHGKPSAIRALAGAAFADLGEQLTVGRYHSLYARREDLPSELTVTAETIDDGLVMAVEHRELPISAVQFHPESIMSAQGKVGLRMLENVMASLLEGLA
ncbi:MAG: anthranilate synthase component I [Myxococcales bacterium]|nr:anthranilate synthase component I [Myxococcales bacterium]